MLMDVPEYAKEQASQPNRQKGMHFGTAQIIHGELLTKNWLEEELAPGRLQLTKIKSIALLKELIAYNRKGNFDRVSALKVVAYQRLAYRTKNIKAKVKLSGLTTTKRLGLYGWGKDNIMANRY